MRARCDAVYSDAVCASSNRGEGLAWGGDTLTWRLYTHVTPGAVRDYTDAGTCCNRSCKMPLSAAKLQLFPAPKSTTADCSGLCLT